MRLDRSARRLTRHLPWLLSAPVGLLALLLGLSLLPTVLFVPLDAGDQALLALGCFAVFLIANRIEGRGASIFLAVLSLAITTRYLHWRVTETIQPETPLQGFFMIGLVLAEIYAGIALFLGYFQTLWPLDRKPVAMPPDPAEWPDVDIYIPTYNESLDIVRPTVLAALAMDWPPEKLHVWILDDGRRPEFRRFAADVGAGYITRPDNKGAKAGNINHAMGVTDAPYIAIFDCDHVATRAFLQLTMGWMLRDARLAMLQTPHHFYSPDPFERNLTADRDVPNEGLMFYGLVQPGNDLWNGSFFCGSCAVIRRTALEEVGGVPHETVTEDCHCSLRMQRRGWNTAYLRMPLASGLATERLVIHIGQRMRWARGMIQILRIENPLFASGLSLAQRLCYFSSTFHFLFAVPRIVFLSSPLAFLLLGYNVIAASPLAIAAYAGSHLVHAIGTSSRLAGGVRHSFWSEIYETTLAFYLLPLTILTLLNPRKGKFNVTDKGGVLEEGYYDLRAVWPNMALAFLLLVGVGFAIHGIVVHETGSLEFQAFLLNGLWAAMCLIPVVAGIAVGRERRQVRQSARTAATVPAMLRLPDGSGWAGTTRDISLGGVALFGSDPVPPAGTRALLDLTLGDGSVTVPVEVARAGRDNEMQLRFVPETLEQEGEVVRAVFGRADAWVDWATHEQDRPMRSLGNVVRAAGAAFVGDTGLSRMFRRGAGRSRARPAHGTAAPALAAPAPPRVAEVVRPRPVDTARPRPVDETRPRLPGDTGIAAGLALALCLGAAAPALAQTVPAGQPVQIIPPVALPLGPALPQPGLAAPAPAAPATAAPATRQVTTTFRQLGIRGPMQLRGVSDLQGVLFGLRADEVVTEARLVVSGATSPALIPELSQIAFTLNEQFVGAVQPDRGAPRFGPLEFTISPLFFAELNRLNVRFSGRYAQECNDPLSGLLWANLSDLSALHMTIARLPLPPDLARLPEPFFDRRVLHAPLTLPFILPSEPNPATLRAAAIAASWFAMQADYRGAQFPVAAVAPAEGNAILIAAGPRSQVPGVELPAFEGPTLALVPNPNDPAGQILVIGGRNAAEAATAATALAFGRAALAGQQALVEAPDPPARRPYDAPRWIATDRPVRFGDLVDPDELISRGYAPGPVAVPVRTAPDLYVARGGGIPVAVDFRAPPGPVADIRVSRLDLAFSGFFLKSLPFRGSVGPWPLSWIAEQVGWPPTVQTGGTAVPTFLVSGQNELQARFDMRPLNRGDCAAIPGEVQASIDPESTIDFSGAHRFAVLPNLAFFGSAGFPFTRLADLSGTAAVLPDRPTPVEVSALLEIVGRLAAIVGHPATGLAVVAPGALQEVAARDLLVIGTLGRQSALGSLLRGAGAPVRVEGARISLALPDRMAGFRHMLSRGADTGPVEDELNRASVRLATPPDGFGALLAFESPLRPGASVVVATAAVPGGLDAVLRTLRNPDLLPQVQGDIVVVSGGTRVEAFRTGAAYWHGTLPFWLWPEFYLGRRPEVMLGVLLVACLLIALPVRRALRARAARRLRARSTGGPA